MFISIVKNFKRDIFFDFNNKLFNPFPFFNKLIGFKLESKQVTECPFDAKQTPETKPTYPVPIIAILIN